MKTWILGAILVASFPIVAAQGADTMGRGAGAVTCAEFAKSYAENPDLAELLAFSWAQGFMTGANITLVAGGAQTYRDLGGKVEDHEAHIRDYCNAHPLAEFSMAVMDLYQSFPKRAASKPK